MTANALLHDLAHYVNELPDHDFRIVELGGLGYELVGGAGERSAQVISRVGFDYGDNFDEIFSAFTRAAIQDAKPDDEV
jgi:hypothetical protein